MYDSIENIKTAILFELGFPTLRVEITDEILDYIINKQIFIYTNYIPNISNTVINLTTLTNTIKLNPENDQKIFGIQMIIPQTVNPQVDSFIISPIKTEYEVFKVYEDLKIKIISQQLNELVYKDFLGNTYSFRFDPETNTINCSRKLTGKVYITYFCNYKNLSEIRISGQRWIFKYSLQLAKNYLGRIRSKFSGSINTLIGAINLDGDTLLNEAKEEINELEEELKRMKTTNYQYFVRFIG